MFVILFSVLNIFRYNLNYIAFFCYRIFFSSIVQPWLAFTLLVILALFAHVNQDPEDGLWQCGRERQCRAGGQGTKRSFLRWRVALQSKQGEGTALAAAIADPYRSFRRALSHSPFNERPTVPPLSLLASSFSGTEPRLHDLRVWRFTIILIDNNTGQGYNLTWVLEIN